MKRGTYLSVTAALLALLLTLTACGSSNNNAAPSEGTQSQTPPSASSAGVFQDAMGHNVAVPASPQRVLASYLEDHLAALGVKPVAQWSVANGVQDYLQPQLQGVPTISYDLPPETVAGFAPDLILIGSPSSVQNGLYDQYAKIAPTYVLGDDLVTDWRKGLRRIGELLGKADEANKAVADYDAKAAGAKAKIQQKLGTPSAAILWLTQKQFYMVDPRQSSGAVLYGDLGLAQPQWASGMPDTSQASWNAVTLEKLAELQADHIFLVNSDKGQGAETTDSAIWQNIPAVKAGHVYEMSMSSSWLYSGAVAGGLVIDDTLKALGIE